MNIGERNNIGPLVICYDPLLRGKYRCKIILGKELQDLQLQPAFEIRRICRASKVTIIPIVIGALGSKSKDAKTLFGKLDVPDFLGNVQLTAILGTADLLRKVLCL